ARQVLRHAEGDEAARRRAGRAGDESFEPPAGLPQSRAAQPAQRDAARGPGRAVRHHARDGGRRLAGCGWERVALGGDRAPAADGYGRPAGARHIRRGEEAAAREAEEGTAEQKEEPAPMIAARALARSPGFAALAAGVLALG